MRSGCCSTFGKRQKYLPAARVFYAFRSLSTSHARAWITLSCAENHLIFLYCIRRNAVTFLLHHSYLLSNHQRLYTILPRVRSNARVHELFSFQILLHVRLVELTHVFCLVIILFHMTRSRLFKSAISLTLG